MLMEATGVGADKSPSLCTQANSHRMEYKFACATITYPSISNSRCSVLFVIVDCLADAIYITLCAEWKIDLTFTGDEIGANIALQINMNSPLFCLHSDNTGGGSVLVVLFVPLLVPLARHQQQHQPKNIERPETTSCETLVVGRARRLKNGIVDVEHFPNEIQFRQCQERANESEESDSYFVFESENRRHFLPTGMTPIAIVRVSFASVSVCVCAAHNFLFHSCVIPKQM